MTTVSDTTSVRADERFDYWNDVVCRNFVPADSNPCGDGSFNARLVSNNLGRFEIGSLRAPPHAWSRSSMQIRIDGRDDVLLSMVVSGSGCLGQDGRVLHQRPGDLALYDAMHPFTYELTDHTVVFKMRRSDFTAYIAHGTSLFATALPRNNHLGRLLGDALVYGAEEHDEPTANPEAKAHLGSSIFSLLLAVIHQARGDVTPSTHAGQLERVKAYVMANLEDPSLSCETLARHAGCSVRTLNRLFTAMDTTPKRWLWQQRLHAARTELTGRRARSVTDVAFRFGFNELSHFSRSFKNTYGVTPQSLLRGGARARGPAQQVT